MPRILVLLFFYALSLHTLLAQEEDSCNKLGVWLWRFEQTGQPSHLNLARTIGRMGGKRCYIKVADGGYNPNSWPTIADQSIPSTYDDEGVEVWGWSYNYPGNEEDQAKALYEAAKTGYKGFVVDIEIEFNGADETLESLMQAFSAAKDQAIADGYADPDFPFYVTTWGNPVLHNYRIDIIDDYVDGFMPQTYIEEWAGPHLSAIEACIAEGEAEYASLGATKPLHHILSTAQEILTAQEITDFMQLAGPESSLWRVPGGGVSTLIWDRWRDVDWDINFCQTVSTQSQEIFDLQVFPNPSNDFITIRSTDLDPSGDIEIYDQHGRLVIQQAFDGTQIDLSSLPKGMYHLALRHPLGTTHRRLVKL